MGCSRWKETEKEGGTGHVAPSEEREDAFLSRSLEKGEKAVFSSPLVSPFFRRGGAFKKAHPSLLVLFDLSSLSSLSSR